MNWRRVLAHCLFHLHRPAVWLDDWLRWHWYCSRCEKAPVYHTGGWRI